jgi:hypothetical protein
MKNELICTTCGIALDRHEAYLTNALTFSCGDCFEEWDIEAGLLDDTYLFDTRQVSYS